MERLGKGVNIIRKLTLFLIIAAFSFTIFSKAKADQNGFGLEASHTLVVGFGLSKPPYVIQSENRGLEYDIIKESLALIGYEIQPKYMPLKRIPFELNKGNLDAAMNLKPGIISGLSFSEPIISYRNYAISLEKMNFEINEIADLANYSMVAFQNAQTFLGKEFASASRQSHSYHEVSDQSSQVKMLAADRIDLVIMDHRIFSYFRGELEKSIKQQIRYELHEVFQPTFYGVAFNKSNIRDAFDQGFKKLKASGKLAEIYKRYDFIFEQ